MNISYVTVKIQLRTISLILFTNYEFLSILFKQDDKSCLEKPVEVQRRYSLVPPTPAVPGISLITDDNSCGTSPEYSRRSSAQSLGTFNLPVSAALDRLTGSSLYRRSSAHSLGVLPIGVCASSEWGNSPSRRSSSHSLGMYSLSYFAEDGWGRPGSRRTSTHSLGPIIVPVSFNPPPPANISTASPVSFFISKCCWYPQPSKRHFPVFFLLCYPSQSLIFDILSLLLTLVAEVFVKKPCIFNDLLLIWSCMQLWSVRNAYLSHNATAVSFYFVYLFEDPEAKLLVVLLQFVSEYCC